MLGELRTKGWKFFVREMAFNVLYPGFSYNVI